jgi:hypothetical protein
MRAEELVAEIYRQKLEVQKRGEKPLKVIMSPEAWEHIRAWHISLGVMEEAPHMDYISGDAIFGLSVELDRTSPLTVL